MFCYETEEASTLSTNWPIKLQPLVIQSAIYVAPSLQLGLFRQEYTPHCMYQPRHHLTVPLEERIILKGNICLLLETSLLNSKATLYLAAFPKVPILPYLSLLEL